MIGLPEILGARILIVDDQAANVSLLEQTLRGAGYSSITATTDPTQVCDLHGRNRYDLILLDLQMPGMDGFQVLEGLKKVQTDGHLTVIVLTAQPGHKMNALKAGARDFVSKPFDLAEILVRVHNTLEVRLLHRSEILLNEARLENAQRIAGLGDWEHDYASGRLSWSAEFYRILGISQETTAPDSGIFEKLVHPADLEWVRRQKMSAEEGLRRVDFEHRIVSADGSVRHIHQIAEVAVDDKGWVWRESGTIQDITERKLAETALRDSEERFRFVARAVSDVVWDWDLPANSLWWNEGFLTTFGFAADEIEPSIDSWAAQIHPEDRGRVIGSVHRAVEFGAESWGAEYRFRRKDSRYAWVQDRGYILRDPAGKAVRMVGGLRDLTEQKKMETQFLRAQRMESIGTLAGGIAHDLNNVLAPIMMSIELLKLDPGKDPRSVKILDTIFTSSRRGADLVRQILSFARGLDGTKTAIRINEVMGDLDAMISKTFPRNIRIVAEVPEDLWPVLGDATQLHQVLLNLAVNARDAMPEGGTLGISAANVTIGAPSPGAVREAPAGTYVLLQVADTGSGMPPEVRERIFEPFFTTKEAGKGTGIGLVTVHNVVKGHGGYVAVTSEPGRGTTFRIHLPADATLHTGAPLPKATEIPLGRGELVLVVDDEHSIRDITQQTLEAFGYRVLTAGDGVTAVGLYANPAHQVALVLTDMMMPVMDGSSTIQALRRINPLVKIIASSGIDLVDNLAKAAGQGVGDFLSKPFTAEALVRLVREVLDNPAGAGSPSAGSEVRNEPAPLNAVPLRRARG
jgi:hypothetical protein